LDEMTAKKKALSQKMQEVKIDEKEVREKAYLKTMQEVRELGFKKGEKLNTAGNTTKTKAKIVEKHMKYFPREWVEASNHTPLEVIFTTKDPYKRANAAHHNSNYEGLVQVSRRFGLNGTSYTV
ncbi:hypothetical protein R2R70_19190, partial [Cobetia sp. SIMBA_158]|uniref:hypothetical protein n=1 Tax=Cobetia sp. SIMBA_158 TaxID=3081617 RepID=UPI00397EB01E